MKFVTPITFTNGMLGTNNISSASDPAAWSNVTTYAIGDKRQYNNVIYQALTATSNKQPDISPADWVDLSPINKYAMFDQRVSSITSNASTIQFVLTPGAYISDMCFLGLVANKVTVTQTDPTDGVVYTEVQDLTLPVGDYDEYCFSPITSYTTALFSGFAPYLNATVTVTIDNASDTAQCGACIFGYGLDLGDAVQYGLSDGITDYSDVATDTFGVRDIVERDYADDATFDVFVDKDAAPEFVRQLKDRHAKPTLVLAAAARSDLVYWGLVSYKRSVPYFDTDTFALTIRGFT